METDIYVLVKYYGSQIHPIVVSPVYWTHPHTKQALKLIRKDNPDNIKSIEENNATFYAKHRRGGETCYQLLELSRLGKDEDDN